VARPSAIIRVTTQGGPFPGVSAAVVRGRAEKMVACLRAQGDLGSGPLEVSIALVDDPTIHELNRVYRKKDRPTDVLAFEMTEPGPTPPARPRLLGDVIVSIETAARQARQRRRRLLDELTMLVAHGLLHLLGYDHRTDAEERDMTKRTRDLVAAAGRRRT